MRQPTACLHLVSRDLADGVWTDSWEGEMGSFGHCPGDSRVMAPVKGIDD